MRLSTETTGSGPRHVGLVHGLGGSGQTWRPLVERIVADAQYTVTTVDLRGHGSSDRASSYRLRELADDLAESLPSNLHSIVGHSLGGAVLYRAVESLAPQRAVYLDPGFQLSLPTEGLAGRVFWAAPLVSLALVQLRRGRGAAKVRAGYDPEVRAALDRAAAQFDQKMAVGVFREVAFSPVLASRPVVPSTIVLSDESAAVLPDALAGRLERSGWDVKRLPRLHHDMHLEDTDRTYAAIRDVL